MTYKVPAIDLNAPIIVIDIGNTSIGIATSKQGKIQTPLSVATDDADAFAEALDANLAALPKGQQGPAVACSVVPEALERVRWLIEERLDKNLLVVGEAIPLPLDLGVKDPATIGVDRVCAAATAFDTIGRGCTVIDFGTAVTVDLVDDDGMLRGGAILPGLRMQLRALHEYTAALPLVEPAMPETPFGRDTTEAIQTGVCRGLAGAVRGLVEAYASSLNQWPQVVATGGDVEFLLPHCDFFDTAVEHLTLRGVALAFQKHLDTIGA